MDSILTGDSGIVLRGGDEFALLQNPDRAGVMAGDEGMQRPFFDFADEGGEGSGRDTAAP